MNEILKKRIEEAAVEHAESIPQSDERKEYSREDFIAGAEYALSHQWISVEDALPEANEHVLTLIGGVPVIAKGYHVRARLRDITQWMPIPKFETKEKKWKR